VNKFKKFTNFHSLHGQENIQDQLELAAQSPSSVDYSSRIFEKVFCPFAAIWPMSPLVKQTSLHKNNSKKHHES
jgi:hypothetical protein